MKFKVRPLKLKVPLLGHPRRFFLISLACIVMAVIFLPIFFSQLPQIVYLKKLPKPPAHVEHSRMTDGTDLMNARSEVDTAMFQSPQVWVIATDLLADARQAAKVAQQLRHQAYPAYVVLSTQGHYSVYIGPETDKARLQDWLTSLQQQDIKGRLIAYRP